MKVTCQATGCTKSAEIPDSPVTARTAGFKKAGFVRLMPPGATVTVCADCRGKLAELALELAKLLGGHEVPLWQLIPEGQRGFLRNEPLRSGKRT